MRSLEDLVDTFRYDPVVTLGFCGDIGFSEAISACYGKTEIQKCIINQIRNSIKYVSYKDVKKITSALQPIYNAPTEQAALMNWSNLKRPGAKSIP